MDSWIGRGAASASNAHRAAAFGRAGCIGLECARDHRTFATALGRAGCGPSRRCCFRRCSYALWIWIPNTRSSLAASQIEAIARTLAELAFQQLVKLLI